MKPGPEDLRAIEAAAADASGRQAGGVTALLLGVTPEIALASWPPGTSLIALDRSLGMVSRIWPRQRLAISGNAAVADWRALPLAGNSVTFAAGDGSFNSLDSIDSLSQVSGELLRVLRPGGAFALRIYARPDPIETPATILDELRRGRIGGFNAFKLRLLMSIPGAVDGSMRLCDAWDTWDEAHIDKAALAADTGWPLAVIETIDSYRGKDVRYVFLTLADMRRRLAPYFIETGIVAKSYELGESCPTLLMRARS